MKLSIITINYNNLEGLKKTLDSVFSQTFKEFEYIVIDGGSTDGSKEFIEQNTDKITYWVSEPDKGIYNAMNKGIKVANGEYLLFLNSGDELYEYSTIKKSLQFLIKEDIISGDLFIISDKKKYIGSSKENITFLHMYNNTIWHPCTFIKKKAFEKTELYDENLKICSDWKWFLIAIYKYNLSYKKINIIVSKFYTDGISNKFENQIILIQERKETLKKLYHFSTNDLKIIDELIKNNEELKPIKEKLFLLKKSRLLKFLYKIGVFKAYKHI